MTGQPGHIRLFTALTVPGAVREMAAALPRKGFEGKWNHPEDLHITIRFLGDLDAQRLTEIRQALLKARRPPFHVEVRGLGVFENRNQTVLYAAVESTRKMTALCAEVTDALVPLGFDFGIRPFVPHITLARLKSGNVHDYARRHGRLMQASWEASEFHLMRSSPPDEKGSHYNSLDRYPLA